MGFERWNKPTSKIRLELLGWLSWSSHLQVHYECCAFFPAKMTIRLVETVFNINRSDEARWFWNTFWSRTTGRFCRAVRKSLPFSHLWRICETFALIPCTSTKTVWRCLQKPLQELRSVSVFFSGWHLAKLAWKKKPRRKTTWRVHVFMKVFFSGWTPLKPKTSVGGPRFFCWFSPSCCVRDGLGSDGFHQFQVRVLV